MGPRMTSKIYLVKDLSLNSLGLEFILRAPMEFFLIIQVQLKQSDLGQLSRNETAKAGSNEERYMDIIVK